MKINYAILDGSPEANHDSTKGFRDLEVVLNPVLLSIIDWRAG